MTEYNVGSLTTKDQLNLLLSFGKAIAYEKDLRELLTIINGTITSVLDCDRSSIFMYDEEKNELWTVVADGVDEIRIPADKGVVGNAVYTKEIHFVVDAYNDFRFNQAVDLETGYVTHTIIAVPLLDKNEKVIGVIQALNKNEGLFGIEDAALLMLLGTYASSTIENAILYDKLYRSHASVLQKIASAAEFNDTETYQHTVRVGLFSRLLGKKYGMSPKEVDLLQQTAPMHDTGKIGIPDAILLKPFKLTNLEYDEMKKHAQIGYDILYDEENELLQIAAIIALDHHEKYDGSGYPNGKKGEEISIFARITAIADVFDALTSIRPYKNAWSVEDAVGLLQKERGKHFDPQLVDIFVNNIDKVRMIMKENQD
jgi:HD-GYP domain-containing protein (c-di-GMP phosphodiesterase class II)